MIHSEEPKNFRKLDQMSSGYCFEVLSSLHAFKGKASDIENFLLKEADEPMFHQNPFVLIAEHKRNPEKKPWGLIVKKNDRILGIVMGLLSKQPLNLEFSVFRIPGPSLSTLILSDSNICFAQNHDKYQTTRFFLSVLRDLASQIDIVYLEQNKVNSLLFEYLDKTKNTSSEYFNIFRSSERSEIISWHVLQKNYNDWFGSYGRKTRKRMTWELNRFKKRAPQPVDVERITSVNDVHRFMKAVETIRSDMWQTKTFGNAGSPLYKEVAFFKTFARRKWLRSYLLTCGGQPISYELAVQYGDEVTFLERGYTQSLRKIGPGTFLTHEIIRDCYEYDPPKRINFGYGENEFKKRLRNETVDACCAFLTSPNVGRLLVKIQQALSMVELRISNILVKIKWDQRVRRFLKSK